MDTGCSEMNRARTAGSVAEVVRSGLCIGCGLCEAVTDGRVRMAATPAGSLRPFPADGFSPEEESRILSACPGVRVEARFDPGAQTDPVWGTFSSMSYAWAGDPEVRFKAATGGALTALGAHAVDSGMVDFVLHVRADPDRPMRSEWVISDDGAAVVRHAGSRYGPVAPLAGLDQALSRGRPFALIAKPCDLNAVDNLSKTDERVARLCVLRLAMVCGGQSRLAKSQALLDEFGIAEDALTVFRYRGYGNPGRTRVETRDGRAFEKTYLELWEDEAGWELETRCKLCPDALGEAADVAAADVWPGGSPTGEDAGINGIVVRSKAGERLVSGAVDAGALVVGDPMSPALLDDCQPHQVRKKVALTARFDGLTEAGMPVVGTKGLRLEELGTRLDADARRRETEGTLRRVREGRFAEDVPGPQDN